MADVTPQNNPILAYAAQAAQTKAASTINATAIAKQTDAINNATSADLAGVDAAASASSIISAAKDSAQLQTSNANANAQTMLGANPDAANYRLQDLTNQRNMAFQKTQEIAGTIAQKQSATLLNDPLGFINAQFTLPADIAQHNYYAELHNSAANEYDTIVSQTTATAQENKAVEATMTAAQAGADQDLISANAQQNKAKIQQANAQNNISGIQALQGINEQQLSNAATGVSVANQAAELQLKREQFPLLMAQRKLTLAYLQDREDRLATTVQDSQAASDAYNAAARSKGAPELPTATIMAKLRQKDPTTQAWMGYGQDIIANGGSAEGVPIAATPAQVGALVGSTPRLIPTGTNSSTLTYLAKMTHQVAGMPAVQSEKDPGARLEMTNKLIANDVATQASTIQDDKPNIYAAPPTAALVSAVPVLANNSFISGVLIPKAKAAPNVPTTANDVISAGMTTIAADPSQFGNVVDGITKYYNAAVQANNKLKGYAETGLPLQQNYPAALSTGILGNTQTIDLTNPTAVKSLLLRKQFGTQFLID